MIYMHNEIPEHKEKNLNQGYKHDLGYDIMSGQDMIIPAGESKAVYTGLRIYMPAYLGMIIQSRSGLAFHHRVECSNAGVIDSGYSDAINLLLYNHGYSDFHVKSGDKVAQAVFHIRPEGMFNFITEMMSQGSIPRFQIEEKNYREWPETERGINGIGSTGV